MSNPEVEQAFKRLAHAVQTGDLSTYQSVALDPRDMFQQQLFERNSAMMKKAGMRLMSQKILVSGDRATVNYGVLTATGEQVETGEMTFARDGNVWKVVEL